MDTRFFKGEERGEGGGWYLGIAKSMELAIQSTLSKSTPDKSTTSFVTLYFVTWFDLILIA